MVTKTDGKTTDNVNSSFRVVLGTQLGYCLDLKEIRV